MAAGSHIPCLMGGVLKRGLQPLITMYRAACSLAMIFLLLTAGCSGTAGRSQPVPQTILVLESVAPAPSPEPEETPAVTVTLPVPPVTVATTVAKTPVPTVTTLSDDALNARIVDARNKLNNLIDSDVADTIVIYPDEMQGCDVKQSRELGYLIDATTGESTFIRGDYGSIRSDLFTGPMDKDHEYVIIHTHPRMWATCQGSGIVTLYTFSIGDLETTADLTASGYHIRYLIAIADKEYRIWPKTPDGWRSSEEIRAAVARIERRYETSYAYYDPVLDREYFEVDSLMPLLVKELDYSYTANNHVIN